MTKPDRKLTSPEEWADQHGWDDCELGPDCECCKELRVLFTAVYTAAVKEARLYELERAIWTVWGACPRVDVCPETCSEDWCPHCGSIRKLNRTFAEELETDDG